jgi:hypothetical protein
VNRIKIDQREDQVQNFYVFSVYNGIILVWFGLRVGGTLPPRYFVGHSIYKGKAALTVEPRAPEFTPLDVCFFDYYYYLVYLLFSFSFFCL